MTPAERRFWHIATRKKWVVIRPGWPDFLCMNGNDEVFGVEVKNGSDWISTSQRETFDFLEVQDVLDIYVWHTSAPKMFMPWFHASAIDKTGKR